MMIFFFIFRAVTGLGPPSGSALKPNVELELPESDLREEMEDSGKNIFMLKVLFSIVTKKLSWIIV